MDNEGATTPATMTGAVAAPIGDERVSFESVLMATGALRAGFNAVVFGCVTWTCRACHLEWHMSRYTVGWLLFYCLDAIEEQRLSAPGRGWRPMAPGTEAPLCPRCGTYDCVDVDA